MERGLRQGDPPSHFLFLLVAEYLHVYIIDACNKGLFKGVYLTKDGSNVRPLQYAGAAFFFEKQSRSNARNLILILKWFEEASGLKVNLSKSVSVGLDEVEAVDSSLNCSHDSLLFMYLGLPIRKSSSRLKRFKIAKSTINEFFMDGSWKGMWSWRIPSRVRALDDLASLISHIGLGLVGACPSGFVPVLIGVFQCALWGVWKWRNKVVNASDEDLIDAKNEDIFPFIQSAACSARACATAELMLLAAMYRLLLAEWSVSRCLAVSDPFRPVARHANRNCTPPFVPAVRFSLLALEMVGSSIYSVNSVLTQRDLDLHYVAFNILAELQLEFPDRDSTIKDSPEGKIGMYTRFIEFANYRIPLFKFLLCIDASVCPLFISWFDGTSVVKDPLPVVEVVDLPCVELLNENRTLIRKYPETFLCLVGVSHSFVEMDVRPTLLQNNDEEMGLLDFVKSADPFKVKVRERTDRVISPSLQTIILVDHTIRDELNVNSGKRKKMVAFASGSLPVKKAQTEGIVIYDSWPDTAGKSPFALQRLSRQNERASTGSGSAVPATEDVTSSFVTHTPQFAHKDASHDNVVPLVTLDPTGANAHVAASMSGDHRSPVLNVYVPNWNVVNNDRLASLVTCRNLLDHVTPPGYWAALRNQHDAMFLDAVNVNSAHHVCMVFELRLRYEHEIMIRENFEKKFTDGAAIIQQRDAEIVDLNTRLEKYEADAAEVIELRKRVSDLEATISVKVGELANLRTENVSLVEKVFALELEYDGLKNQVVGEGKIRVGVCIATRCSGAAFCRAWVVGRGLRLDVYKCARSMKCRSTIGRVISMDINKGIQQGLEAGVVHGNAGSASFHREEKLCLPSSSALGGAFSSAPPHDSSLGVADYQIAAFSLLSYRMSRFRSMPLSFSAWFTSAHLSEGIPISTGITASVPLCFDPFCKVIDGYYQVISLLLVLLGTGLRCRSPTYRTATERVPSMRPAVRASYSASLLDASNLNPSA
uniref:Transposase (Putative), gypsy type n=1 Tax=Tanacetum cinerariifolium TaxID=118510 RepID=A0A6L2NK02_TANCI|nr:transposase (putative), gypsy type [Tanacetum cinerariifolium]